MVQIEKSYWCLLLTIGWINAVITRVSGVVVWDAPDHVVGNWDLTIHGISDEELFPRCSHEAFNDQASTKAKQRKRRQAIRCNLSLFTNGTFNLEPQQEDETEEISRPSPIHDGLTSHRRLHLHGRWKVDPNPYCVTDRFYDHLLLEGYPRVQKLVPTAAKRSSPHLLSPNHTPEPLLLQQVAIQLSCRIWGRYYRQKRQYQQCRRHKTTSPQQHAKLFSLAHMTHGSLLWQGHYYDQQHQNEETKEKQYPKRIPWWKQRRVAATFSGKLWSSSAATTDELVFQNEDQDIFGY